MNPYEYLKASARTESGQYEPMKSRLQDEYMLKLLHGAIGMVGEAGEVSELIKKHMLYGQIVDRDKLIKECGDVLWYMAVLLRAIDSSFEECMDANIGKLQARYPHKFSELAAIERKDEQK